MRPARHTALVMLSAALLLAAVSAWGAVTGIVSGAVTGADTGKPLSGANVRVIATDLSTVTEPDGSFVITNVPPGSYSVSVSLVGYAEAAVTEVMVTQGQETRLPVTLTPTEVVVAGSETKIVAPRAALHPDQPAPAYVVTAKDQEILQSANANDRKQFTELVFSQPGVVPDNTFYPHIRGARANQVGYFLDGIPITEPNANVFATNVVSIGLDRLELFTGSYPIEYGGFTGGVINEVVKRGDQVQGGLFDLGAGSPDNFGGLTFERGDVDGSADWYYGLNTWHSNFNENLFTSSAPVVSDHIGKLVLDAGERDKVTVLAHHGYARYLFPFERLFTFDPESSQWVFVNPSDTFGRQGYDLNSIGVNHTISPTAFWNLRFSRLDHFLHLDLGDPGNVFWQQRNERMFIGQFDYQRQLGPHRLSAGLWQVDSDNNSRFSVFGTQYSPFGLLDSVANNNTRNTQAYLGDKWQLTDRLLLSLGVRHDRMNYDRPTTDDATLSETTARGGATYTVSPRFLVRAAVGAYVGFPRANLIAAQYLPHETENPDFIDWGLTWDMVSLPFFPLRPQLDREREFGFEWRLGSATLLSTSLFRRKSHQVMQKWQGEGFDLTSFDPEAATWFAANGTGTTRGVEVKLDRKLSRDTRAWLSYTYMNATATSAADNLYPFGYGFLNQTDAASLAQEFPVDWNQKHTAALVLHRQFGKLSVDPWVTYGSGFPFGQSGLDVGGSDPAHVPNPDWNPEDPLSPEELVIPENYLGGDPANGFIEPNSLMTGRNLTLSLNLAYQIGPGRQAYFQIFNLTDRDDVTSYVIYHPRTGGLLGDVASGEIRYVPFSRTPPRFFAFGIKQQF